MVQLLKAATSLLVVESLCKITVQPHWYSGTAVQSVIRDFLSPALLNASFLQEVLLAGVGLCAKLHHMYCPCGALSRAWGLRRAKGLQVTVQPQWL